MFDTFFGERKWKKLPTTVSEDSESEDGFITGEKMAEKPTGQRPKFLYLVLILSTFVNFGLLMYTFVPNFQQLLLLKEKNAVLKQCSHWSPILDDIEIPTFVSTMNLTFFPPEYPTIARQEPSPSIDTAWGILEDAKMHKLTKQDVINLGKDPATIARFENDYWGFGDEAYIGSMDVFHQMHCLNLIRMAAFKNYASSGPLPRTSYELVHLAHCVDSLFQTLMCTASTEFHTSNWMEGHPKLWPDFSINRQCKDFDTIVKWANEHSVDMEKFNHMPVPEDAYLWPAPWRGNPDSEAGRKLAPPEQKEHAKYHHEH